MLDVPADATTADIAEAFLAEARHPAEHPVRTARAAAALAVLSDPVRRARYDAARLEDLACCPSQPAGTGGAGNDAGAPDRRPGGKRAREEQARRKAAAQVGRRDMIKQGAVVGVAARALFVTGRQFEPFPTSAASVSPSPLRAAGDAAPAQPSVPAAAPTRASAASATNGAPTQPPLPRPPQTSRRLERHSRWR